MARITTFLNKKIFTDIIIGLVIFISLSALLFYLIISTDYNFRWHKLIDYFAFFDGGFHLGLIIKGVIFTVKLSILIILSSTFLGILFAVTRYLYPDSLGFLIYIISEFLRFTPPIVVMFIFYFFLGDKLIPDILIDMIIENQNLEKIVSIFIVPPEIFKQFLSAAIGLAFYEASYISEIIRGGLNGVSRSQFDAAFSLGLTKYQVFLRIVFPQAWEKTMPAMAGQYISIIKNTSIASVIAIPELTFVGTEIISSTMLVFEVWFSIMIIYFIINFTLSTFVNRLDYLARSKYS
ncbi:MAG: amino acid ABC transporter permease [Calditerrivibrio sp.]|nr:amino acid ABC transporter permease [Calditerrivibrio sp.]